LAWCSTKWPLAACRSPATGKAIVVYDRRTGTPNLWSQPLDGSPMKQLTDFKPDGVFTRALSPDGKWMALSRGTITSDVILISDFR
jgi:Tol biopolymer transport system component